MINAKNAIYKNLTTKILCLLIISLAGVLLYVGLQKYTDSMYQYYSKSFRIGQIADEDLLVGNSIDVYDQKATEKLKEENAKAILPVYMYSIESTLKTLEKFDQICTAIDNKNYSYISSICGSYVSDYFKSKDSASVLSICYEVLQNMLDEGIYSYEDIQSSKKDRYSSFVLIRDSEESVHALNYDIINKSYLGQFVDERILKYADFGITLSEATVIKNIILSVADENVEYDSLLTLERRQTAEKETDPIYIHFEKGQVLLAKDRVITESQLDLIKILGNSSRITVLDIIGESSFILISVFFSLFLYCYFLNSEKYHLVQYLWITTVTLVITCVASFFAIRFAVSRGISFVESCVPICLAPVLITMITGKRNYGYITSFMVGLLITGTPGSSYLTIIYCTVCGIVSCFLVRFFNKRTDMVVQWLLTVCFTTLLTALFVFIGSYPNSELLYDLLGNIIHITMSEIIIAILLPILERVFNLPTVFRLNELAYGNNPLLEKLSDAAPGTYSHSKMVAELADAASKSIGANALLARVGGLFHDVGKVEHPEYFVENESGTNKHQELNPGLSVSIIKSHVKIGSDMGRESGLPVEIIDIIANHHGNDIIAFFYNEAKKQADEDDVVSSVDYSYSGSSIPETRECGIVMLADSIEAAARTVSEPTTAKFTKLIKSIVNGKFERGQLDACDISMKEIISIEQSFLKTLSAQYHSRIEYPDEEKDK